LIEELKNFRKTAVIDDLPDIFKEPTKDDPNA